MHREKIQAVLETAGAVCHELNQPMMAALGNTELALMNLSNDTLLRDKITNIREQIERMGDITKKLMGITRYHIKDYGNGGKIIDIEKSSVLSNASSQPTEMIVDQDAAEKVIG